MYLYLHGFLLVVVAFSQFRDLFIFVFDCNLVAVKVLLLLSDSLFNDIDLFLLFRLLLDQVLSPCLSKRCCLFGILILSLHEVILFLERFDFLFVILRVLGPLSFKLVHILLQLHN